VSGQKRTKADIFVKFVEINGRLVPLIGGGAPEEGDGAPESAPEQKDQPKTEHPTPDVEALVKERLDEHARALGFESWDDMQVKILEQEGRTQEYIEKLKENYNKQLAQLQKEAQEYKRKYEETVIKSAILGEASQLSVDPELVYALLRDKAVIAENGVMVDGKPVREAVEELLRKRPHLAKATGAGSGTPSVQTEEEPQSFEELLKNPAKLVELKKNNPELYEKLKAEYFAKHLGR